MKVHIGKKIRESVKRSGMSVTEFAEKINYSRRNIYSIFTKESIDTALLEKISKVLEQDFLVYFKSAKEKEPEYNRVDEPAGESGYYEKLKANYENKVRELSKEVEYLKEINTLLKMQIEKLKASPRPKRASS